MKTIKIIDLLNRMSTCEKVPKKIKYNNNIYEYCRYDNRYHQMTQNYPNRGFEDLSKVFGNMNFNYLNDEVEIIEEDKKIEKLLLDMNNKRKGNMTADYDNYMLDDIVEHNFNVIHKKLNELIDTINELKEDK